MVFVRVRENAELIAFYGGENNEMQLLLQRFKSAFENLTVWLLLFLFCFQGWIQKKIVMYKKKIVMYKKTQFVLHHSIHCHIDEKNRYKINCLIIYHDHTLTYAYLLSLVISYFDAT